VEALVGVVTAGVVVLSGSLPFTEVAEQVEPLLPVVAFLAAILVVGGLCAAEGVFAAVGVLLSRLGRHRPRRMLLLVFAAAAVTTAVLSLDATVVLLTPVVAAAAAGSAVEARPGVHACVRLANSGSLLFPVSNLTNLLALGATSWSFLGFAARTLPVWLVLVAVEYVAHRLLFAADLPAVTARPDAPRPAYPLPRLPLVALAVMLAGFAAASPLDIAPAWVAAAAAVVLAVHAVRRRRVRLVDVVHAAHLSFGVYVLCLGVVVAGVVDGFLGGLVATVLPDVAGAPGLPELLAIALVATVLANLVNNLPATLLLVPLVAPMGGVAVLAALVGLNVGSGLTWTGSLANLLWRRIQVRAGQPPSSRAFHRYSLLVTPPAVAVAVVVVWGWDRLLTR
jgi:arsenical pump membrane protein